MFEFILKLLALLSAACKFTYGTVAIVLNVVNGMSIWMLVAGIFLYFCAIVTICMVVEK